MYIFETIKLKVTEINSEWQASDLDFTWFQYFPAFFDLNSKELFDKVRTELKIECNSLLASKQCLHELSFRERLVK